MQCWKILRTKNSTRIFETFETKVIESHMYTWNFNMKPERSEKLSSFLATVAIFGFHVFIFKFRQSSLLTTNRFPSFPQEEFAKGEAEDMMEVEFGWDEENHFFSLWPPTKRPSPSKLKHLASWICLICLYSLDLMCLNFVAVSSLDFFSTLFFPEVWSTFRALRKASMSTGWWKRVHDSMRRRDEETVGFAALPLVNSTCLSWVCFFSST